MICAVNYVGTVKDEELAWQIRQVALDGELWSENLQCDVTLHALTDMTHCWVVNLVMKFQFLKRVGDYQLRRE